MISVTKKQTSLALVVVAFATIMIAGTIASSGSAFAWRERHHHDHFSHFDSITLTTLTAPITTAKYLTLTKA